MQRGKQHEKKDGERVKTKLRKSTGRPSTGPDISSGRNRSLGPRECNKRKGEQCKMMQSISTALFEALVK
jgi:hypothetical protein